MGRYGHDGAGAVFIKDIVRDPDRHSFAGERMDGIAAGEHAQLFRRFRRAVDVVLVLHLFNESADLIGLRIAFDQLRHEGMFRREHHVGDAVHRVHAGRVDGDRIVHAFHFEGELRARGTADPVALHRLDAFRPARHMIEISQQTVRVGGDLQEPLGQVFLHHRRLAAPAAAFFDLFIGEHRVAALAPVDLRFFFVGKASLVENFKQFLGMLVIIFAAGEHLPVPVVGQPQLFLLAGHIVDIGIRPFRRRDAVLDRGVFRRHAESVKSHGMDHIEALHLLEAGDHIADGIVSYMAHVQIAGGIREHLQYVILFLIRVFPDRESVRFLPDLLPFLFDLLRNVFFHTITFHTFRKYLKDFPLFR